MKIFNEMKKVRKQPRGAATKTNKAYIHLHTPRFC